MAMAADGGVKQQLKQTISLSGYICYIRNWLPGFSRAVKTVEGDFRFVGNMFPKLGANSQHNSNSVSLAIV